MRLEAVFYNALSFMNSSVTVFMTVNGSSFDFDESIVVKRLPIYLAEDYA